MTEKRLIIASRVISSIISPFYLPMFGVIALFMFTYLGMLETWMKLRVLLIVYLFTAIIPTYLIRIYQYYHGWTPIQLGQKERRMVPYSFHRNGNNSGTRHTGGLRLDKPSMEGFNSLGGHRWRDRQRDSILVPFHVQSHMVAVPALLHGRTCWHKSHDIAAAHADGGVDGLHHGHHCCLPVSYLL